MSDSAAGGVVRAVVAGHGEFASGLISAVAQITGRGDEFVALSNNGLSAADVERAMRELVARYQIPVIFTDLPAGSCTMAARRLQREQPALLVVTGTNLPVLLDYVFPSRDSLRASTEHAAEKGRASLQLSGNAGGA